LPIGRVPIARFLASEPASASALACTSAAATDVACSAVNNVWLHTVGNRPVKHVERFSCRSALSTSFNSCVDSRPFLHSGGYRPVRQVARFSRRSASVTAVLSSGERSALLHNIGYFPDRHVLRFSRLSAASTFCRSPTLNQFLLQSIGYRPLRQVTRFCDRCVSVCPHEAVQKPATRNTTTRSRIRNLLMYFIDEGSDYRLGPLRKGRDDFCRDSKRVSFSPPMLVCQPRSTCPEIAYL